MKKNKHDVIFLEMAQSVSKMSKCISFNVGCVIVKDGRVISMGYNGTPAGYINCCDMKWPWNGPSAAEREAHHVWSKKFEIHAEINAILYAAKSGVCIDKSKIYCTLMPCNDCLKALMQSGVTEIIYSKVYDKTKIDEEVKNMIDCSGIVLRQLKK